MKWFDSILAVAPCAWQQGPQGPQGPAGPAMPDDVVSRIILIAAYLIPLGLLFYLWLAL